MSVKHRALKLVVTVLLAACGSDSGTAPVIVASVEVEAPASSVLVGETMQLTAVARDSDGRVISGRNATWTSNLAEVAEVTAAGLVTGKSPGVATISATVEGVRGQFTVQVVSASAPTISSVSPAELVEGQPATIEGSNFNPSPNANLVLVGGAPAVVTSATATRLEIVVPSVCIPGGPVPVVVESGGARGAAFNHVLSAPAAVTLRVGEQLILQNSADLCLRLGPSSARERYLIGVQSTSEVASTVTPIRVTGAIVSPLADGAAAQGPAAPPPTAQRSFGAGVVPSDAGGMRWMIHRRAERGLRVGEQQFVERRGGSLAALGATRTGAASTAPPRVVNLGDTVTLRLPERGDICESFTNVRAVARAVGQYGVWLDDILNPPGFTAAHYADLSRQFDEKIYATTVSYFGEPTDLDSNDKILILTTQEINRANANDPERAILGYVSSSDFYPRHPHEGCMSSNEGEIYYGVAPDPGATLGWTPWDEPYTVEMALADAPLLIAHEFTHVIQLGRRIINPATTTIQTIWELEGQATLAEEVVGHAMTGRRTGQNYGVDVAFNLDDEAIDWYLSGFMGLVHYFGFDSRTARVSGAPEQCSWLSNQDNGPCRSSGSLVYGVSWSFLRWLSDQAGASNPGGEQGLHRSLIDNVRMRGYANVAVAAGTPIRTLLAQWSAALYVDGRVPNADPRLTFRSWDMADIFGSLVETATLAPQTHPFGSFTSNATVRAGSTAYFTVGGQARPATGVGATTPSQGALPAHMQMWVVRLE
jgi:hypothetical protein